MSRKHAGGQIVARSQKFIIRVRRQSKVPGESYFWQVFLDTPYDSDVVAAGFLTGTEAEAQDAAEKAKEAYRKRRPGSDPF